MKIYIVNIGYPEECRTHGYFLNKEDAIACGAFYMKSEKEKRYSVTEYELDDTDYELLIDKINEEEEKKNKLKPCPFCGSKVVYMLNEEDNLGFEKNYVFCNSCKTSFSNEHAEDYEKDTVKWWNKLERNDY